MVVSPFILGMAYSFEIYRNNFHYQLAQWCYRQVGRVMNTCLNLSCETFYDLSLKICKEKVSMPLSRYLGENNQDHAIL